MFRIRVRPRQATRRTRIGSGEDRSAGSVLAASSHRQRRRDDYRKGWKFQVRPRRNDPVTTLAGPSTQAGGHHDLAAVGRDADIETLQNLRDLPTGSAVGKYEKAPAHAPSQHRPAPAVFGQRSAHRFGAVGRQMHDTDDAAHRQRDESPTLDTCQTGVMPIEHHPVVGGSELLDVHSFPTFTATLSISSRLPPRRRLRNAPTRALHCPFTAQTAETSQFPCTSSISDVAVITARSYSGDQFARKG